MRLGGGGDPIIKYQMEWQQKVGKGEREVAMTPMAIERSLSDYSKKEREQRREGNRPEAERAG